MLRADPHPCPLPFGEAAMDPKLLTPLLIVGLIAWRIYRRLRRNFGRQRVRPRAMALRMGVLALLAILLAVGTLTDSTKFAALLAGCACGAAIGYVGLRYTRFEVTPEARYYTPHAYLGVAVTALFVGRILYDLLAMYQRGVPVGSPPANPLVYDTPLTLALFGVLVGYYLAYYAGVLLRTKATPPPSANPIQY
jgi:UDP-N-acetylmuramyl pentapeptide phosphotransferase/UDP-N-acetylglucosamine-1-phosphate transferase